MSDTITTPELRQQLLMKCLEITDGPSEALLQAGAMVRFIDTGEVHDSVYPKMLPAPAPSEQYNGATKPLERAAKDRAEEEGSPAQEPQLQEMVSPPDLTAQTDTEPEETQPTVEVAWRDAPALIERDARGRVKWSKEAETLLAEALEHGGAQEAVRVFGLSLSAVRVKASSLGLSTVAKNTFDKPEEPKPERSHQPPRVKPKQQAVDAGDTRTAQKRLADDLRSAIVWLEKHGYALNFEDGSYDVWPENDDNAGQYDISKADLINYAREKGWEG